MSVNGMVTRIAARGDGVTDDGRFIPFAAPGDHVDADGIIRPGPHHQEPPCRHFPECGGCQLQHLDDAAYAVFLTDRVAGALQGQGLILPEMRTPWLSPPRSRRRASLRVENRGGRVRIGFNPERSHRIVDIAECHVLRPELFAIIVPLRRMLAHHPGTGGLRLTLAEQGIELLLENIAIDGLEASERIAAFAAEHELARLATDDGYGPQTLWEPQPVTVVLGGLSVPLPHGAFLQATEDGEAALVAGMREAIGDARIVADLFAGLGTFALSIDGKVLAAEGARDAALALKAAADRAQRPVFVDHRDLFRRPLTSAELSRFEAVILDPPRAGAKEQMAELAQASTPRIAYISCNPSTFARDAEMLVKGGYRLDWVRPVGQFRWSTHVELVAAFSK